MTHFTGINSYVLADMTSIGLMPSNCLLLIRTKTLELSHLLIRLCPIY